ncbi:MAG: serine protein kinase PrkA [Deltaproteobacteria bacterium]|nr:serine protein kinase PrkA [Deltaproteobacteria bacterium]
MRSADKILSELSSNVKKSFEDSRTILSYREWLEIALENPERNLRNSAQYVRDVFDHYGVDTLDLPQGATPRFRLFDAPWSPEGVGRVAGQEAVQQEIYRLISNFVRDGKVSRLVMLHGPNGSAKSSFVRCIQTAMEHYSRTTEGALYSYAWVFPSEKLTKGSLGFGGKASSRSVDDGFAHLDPELIDARLPCELRDHPIFFVPRDERKAFIAELKASGKLSQDFVPSRYLLDGDLSPRDRAIYDALLVAHEGRHEDVLRYVQVERFYVSAKYGRGVATVDPQDLIDAHAEQVTADRSLANLPRGVQNVTLYRLWGPLISANRGLLEYADILKRETHWLKYLLTTSEEATAALPQFKVHLDEILIASTNETYLEEFKKFQDWPSFKGRMELVAVPYLRRFSDEVRIYQTQITPTTITKPLAPHVVEVAAMWAVLTRLQKPDKGLYPPEVKPLIDRLTPVEKLRLYDKGTVPAWCTTKDARELRRAIPLLLDEGRATRHYEGHQGASAREIRTLILNAAHHPKFKSLTPLPVLDELKELVSNPSVYPFLRIQAQDGYHDVEKFIEAVRQWWLDELDREIRVSMGLIEEKKYEELFARYVMQVSTYVKKERVLDKVTGKYVSADEELMKEVESSILQPGEQREDFRKAIIGQIGAWSLEHLGQTPDYRKLFANHVNKLESDYYAERRKVISRRLVDLLKLLGDGAQELSPAELEAAQLASKNMRDRFGYPDTCTAECCAYLLKARYSNVS